MPAKHPTAIILARFQPFNGFSEQQCILAAAQSEIRECDAEQIIMDIGSSDDLEYFLVRGSVELESFDGRFKRVDADSDSAKAAVAALQPRKYRVKTLGKCTFIVIPQNVVQALLNELPKTGGFEFSAGSIHIGSEARDILRAFEDDLKSNRLQLPSFPDVAVRIRQLMEDPNVTVKDIAEALLNEPAMTVKLIKTCNSPIYRRSAEITSCQDAIVRLGFDTTKQLVTIFSLREVFKTNNPKLKYKISELWSHSTEVAAIAHVLATLTPGIKPEFAMLAGLIQDIGAVPILNYLERYPHIIKMDTRIDTIIDTLKQKIGTKMLESWGFHGDLVNVAGQSENWQYQSPGATADCADICIVAQLHSFIGKKQHHKLPAFDQVPAFGKLGKSGLTPEQSSEALQQSRKEIEALHALLNPTSIPVLRR